MARGSASGWLPRACAEVPHPGPGGGLLHTLHCHDSVCYSLHRLQHLLQEKEVCYPHVL